MRISVSLRSEVIQGHTRSSEVTDLTGSYKVYDIREAKCLGLPSLT